MTSSATPPSCSQVEPVKSSCCTVCKMDLSFSEFSDTSSSFLASSLIWNQVRASESEAEDSGEEIANRLNATVLRVN